jgi:hypothetical protein
MDAIKFPISFEGGRIARVEEGTTEYYKQLLSISTLTEPTSLPITPDFGIWDPTFNTVEKGQFIIHSSRFVPEVEIEQINVDINDNGENLISFSFRIR